MRFQTQNPLNDDTPRAPNYGLHPSENLRALPTDGKLRSAAMLDKVRWQVILPDTIPSPLIMQNLCIKAILIYTVCRAIWHKSILFCIGLYGISWKTDLICSICRAIWRKSILFCFGLYGISWKTDLIRFVWRAIWCESILFYIGLHGILYETDLIRFVWCAI